MTNEEYVKLQDMWLKATRIEVGSWARVMRKAETCELGWDNMWLPEMDKDVGKTLQVKGSCGAKGLLLSVPHTKLYFPFFVLEPAEEPKQTKYLFTPFEQVLVRDGDDEIWRVNLFNRYDKKNIFPFEGVSCDWKQCVPYAGHEALPGTTDEPENWAKYYDKE